jgi:hypothetical protein
MKIFQSVHKMLRFGELLYIRNGLQSISHLFHQTADIRIALFFGF